MSELEKMKHESRVKVAFLNVLSQLVLYTNNQLIDVQEVPTIQNEKWFKVNAIIENIYTHKKYNWTYSFATREEAMELLEKIREIL